MGLLADLVVGLIAGWLAGQVMKGGGDGDIGTSFWDSWAVCWAAGFSGCWESGRAAE